VGRGGFIFLAFLDLNGNGKKDNNEPKVLGLNLSVNGGRIVRSDRDSTIQVIDLIPYTSYLVEVDKNSIQFIAWRIKNLTLSVTADPNQMKTIEIPITVMGEASGTVNVKTKNGSRGLGGVYVYFFRNDQTMVARILTEGDGYFSYMGLQPGKYIARLDSSQLKEIRMKGALEFKSFTVAQSKEGDVAEGLDFTLLSTVKDNTENVLIREVSDTVISAIKTVNIISDSLNGINHAIEIAGIEKLDRRNDSILPGVRYSKGVPSKSKLIPSDNSVLPGVRYSKGVPSKNKPIQKKDSTQSGKPTSKGVPTIVKQDLSSNLKLKRVSQITVIKGLQYAIQVGAYVVEKNAISVQQKIKAITDLSVNIVSVDGLYKIWIEGFTGKRQAGRFVKQLSNIGLQSYVMMVYR
jgi:hypothetical protein